MPEAIAAPVPRRISRFGVPSRADLGKYVVNRPGWEAIRQSLYDFQPYAAAGQQQLTFFSLPLGQGVGLGGGAKTYSDTNMHTASMLPQNQEFLIESIEIMFNPTIPSVAAQMPGANVAALTIPQIVNDAYVAQRTGNLQFIIGSKPYLQEAPLGRFPPKAHFALEGAATTTVAASQLTALFPYWTGRPYMLKPASLLLNSNQNFSVTLNWPEGAQALPSGNAGRIGLILDGFLYRRSQ